MEYHAFGRTGVRVSRFALGAMAFGWKNVDRPSFDAIVHPALDADANLFDTADMYARTEAEQF